MLCGAASVSQQQSHRLQGPGQEKRRKWELTGQEWLWAGPADSATAAGQSSEIRTWLPQTTRMSVLLSPLVASEDRTSSNPP